MASLVALLLLLCCACGSAKPTPLSKRRRAMVSSGGAGGLVPFSDANFSVVADRKRDFALVVVLTAQSAHYGCSICQLVEAALLDVAEAYHRQRRGAPHAVFFATLDVDANRQLFNRYGFKDAPHVYVLPPRTAKGDALRGAQEVFNLREYEQLTGAKLVERLAPMLGLEIRMEGDNGLAWGGLLLLVLVLAGVGHHADGEAARLVALARNKRIWMAISLVVYGFGVSGSVSCIIRGTALYNRYGPQPSLFSQGGRDQFVLEGLVISGLCLLIALVLIGAYAASRHRREPAGLSTPWQLLYGVLRMLLTTLALAATIVLLARLFRLYTFKTNWYRLSETAPGIVRPYLDAPAKVTKSQGLLRRLIKFSHYGLNDAKSFAAMGKRFDVLILSYIKRKLSFWG